MSVVCSEAARARCADDCAYVPEPRPAWCDASGECPQQACYAADACRAQPCVRRTDSFSRSVETARAQAAANPDDAKLACIFYTREDSERKAWLAPLSFPAEEYSDCRHALQDTQAFFPVTGVWEDLGRLSPTDADRILKSYLGESPEM